MDCRVLLIASAALLTSACSLSGIGESASDPQPDEFDIRQAFDEIHKVYGSLKLSGNPEISAVQRVRGGYLAEWSMCLRNDIPDKRAYYTFYFKNRKISEWKLSAIVDACESERFTPLPPP